MLLMKNTTIREKQAAAQRIYSEFDTGEDDNLFELLQPFFPQPEVTEDGLPYFEPDEVQAFDALFERFGLNFRSSDDKFYDIRYVTELWYRLCENFGSHIFCSKHSPKLHAHLMKEMPADFQDYIRAVIAHDSPETQRLALKLDVENLQAFCVKGMFGG